ncbi:LamG-like jellyroll fold domain-containing protein [Botryobacter ruber]|uniref:LamG-like jellyroll fold domain-containing protein n=1 Tax=Botryobacter ruber TaxID=2171629 RepID=UPI000E0CB15E|nr:LamG-like jellyroll fold domain-containing protein [Botryobacter ruber]
MNISIYKSLLLLGVWLCCALLPGISFVQAQQITKLEYFINQDPGYGKATAIAITAGTDVTKSFPIDIASLPAGFHNLHVRARNANGLWTTTLMKTFYKQTLADVVPGEQLANITKGEYFFDTDPGYGLGTPISISPGQDLQNVTLAADISALSNGFHNLHLRFKSANGKWSTTTMTTFFKQGISQVEGAARKNIVKGEYYVDTDPGFGKGTNIPLTAAPDLTNLAFTLDMNQVSVGNHKLYIRFKNEQGLWSAPSSSDFEVAAPSELIVTTGDITDPLCAGATVAVPFTVNQPFGSNNIFKAELSNASGSFDSPVIIGTLEGQDSDTIRATIPATTAAGTNYRIRVTASSPDKTSAPTAALSISKLPNNFAITGLSSTCTGAQNYTITQAAQGEATYTWEVSGGGTVEATGSTATVNWTTAGTHTLKLTIANACGNSIAKELAVQVLDAVPASAPTLTKNSLQLQASAAPAGSNVTGYQWYLNGNSISGATGATYQVTQPGSYTVAYKNACGSGTASSPIVYTNLKQDQTITFTSLPDRRYGDAPFTVSATASSGLPVSFEVAAGPASISGNTVTLTGTGTVTIRAIQAGNDTYNAATPVEQSFSVQQATENNCQVAALSFDGSNDYVLVNAPTTTSYTIETWVNVTTVANSSILVGTNSGGPGSSWSHQLRISNGKFQHYLWDGSTRIVESTTPVVAGEWYHVAIVATQNGAMRLYVNGVEEGTTVNVGTPWSSGTQYRIGSSSSGYGYFSGVVEEVRLWNVALTATEIQDGKATAITPAHPKYANLTNHWKLEEGTGTITADAKGSATGTLVNMDAATAWTSTNSPISCAPVPVKQNQTITFAELGAKTFGDAAFELSASATSGLPVSFAVVSGPATVAGNKLSITGAGTVKVRATQTGNESFYAAPAVERTFEVAKATATIQLASLTQVFTGTAKTPAATTTPAGIPVTFTFDGSSTAPVNAGTYAFEATINSPNYVGSATGTLVVEQASQHISFAVITDKFLNESPLTLNATAASGLAVSYEIVSGPASVAGNEVTLTGLGTVEIKATQAGNENYLPAAVAQRFNVISNVKPVLTISNLPAEAMEGAVVTFRVNTDLAPTSPLQVFLTTSSPSRFPLPASVTIPAGSLYTDVTVTLEQDIVPELELAVQVKAGAANHTAAMGNITVKDDDVPGLELVLHSTVVSEGGGAFATQATLKRLPGGSPVAFTANLTASVPNTLIVPASIPLAANENEKTFTVGVVDNSLADGDRQVNLTAAVFVNSCSCNAPATSSGSVTTTLTVTDNDGPALTLKASQLTLPEGFATAGRLRIARNTPTTTALTVNLTSSNTNEATVPATTVIAAGQAFVEVPITTVNDGVTDGNKQVYFHASSEGFSTGSVWVMVTDQNLPDLQLASVSVGSAQVQAGALFNYSITVKNSGFATAPTGVVVRGYLSKDDAIDATDKVVSEDVIAVSIPAGQTVQVQNAVQAPNTPGDFKILYWVNPDATLTELLSTNNKAAAVALKINPDYTATALVSNAYYLKGQPVPVTGKATRFNGADAANAPVEVYIITNGLRRTVTATTDNTGNYSTSFVPLANEAGFYTIGASFPGIAATTEQDNFNILGVRINNGQVPQFKTTLDQPLTGTLAIKNMSNKSLSNFTLAPVTLPNGAQMQFETVPTLAGNASINLPYTVTGAALSPGTNFEVAKLQVVATEGNVQTQDVFYFCQAPSAFLVADAGKLDVAVSSATGERLVELRIMNKGQGATGKVTVNLPQTGWLTSLTPAVLPSLATNDTAVMLLKFLATADVPFNYPVKGNLTIDTENGNSLNIPFAFEKKSESTGTLKVDVTNQFTYYSEGAPKVAGARVVVKNYFSGVVYADGVTDATGVFTAAGIPEGKHRIVVEKEKHQPYDGTITINPGGTTETSVFLNYQAITFNWSVVPTAVEDKYDITLEAKFETHVPMPVVTIDMPKTLPQLTGDEIYAFKVTLTNHGLIAAEDVALNLPQHDPEYEFVTNYEPARLLAQQSIQVPFIMRRRDTAAGGETLVAGGPSVEAISEFLGIAPSQYTTMATQAGLNCRDFAQVVYWYSCNISTGLWQQGGALFSFEGRVCGEDGPDGGGGGLDPNVIGRYAEAFPSCAICPSPDNFKGKPGWQHPQFVTGVTSCVDCINNLIGAVASCIPGSNLATGVSSASCVFGNVMGGKGLIDYVPCVPNLIPFPVSCAKAIWDLIFACGNTSTGGGAMSASAFGAQRAFDTDPLGPVFQQIGNDLKLVTDAYEAREAWGLHYFGNMLHSDAWKDLEPLLEPYISTLEAIPAEEQTAILAAMQGYEIPQATIQAFFVRWNKSIEALEADVLEPNAQYPDIINWNQVQAWSYVMKNAYDAAVSKGYSSVLDMHDQVRAELDELLNEQKNAVCASVKVQFSQQLTMTREAFEGTLDIFNGHPTDAMEMLSVNIRITDANGVPSNGVFEIQTKSLTNLSDVTGSGAIGSQQNGIVKFLFIPERDAAPTVPVVYNFGGTVRYFDPYAKAMVDLPLADVPLTVNPSPNLMLHYFMERNILGDDALTKNVVEPSLPAELAVMVENQGYGPAVNMMISSAQPKIIENEKGLAINFNIVGSNFQGQPKKLGVTDINFGTIPALQTRIGQWYFTSSLLGKFVEYQASVVHANSYGNPELSLVKGVQLHELTRSIRAYGTSEDVINDFLVNDEFDAQDVPDVIYFSQGNRTEKVIVAANGSFNTQVAGPSFTNTLTVTASAAGWNYIKLPDPGNRRYELVSVTRNDGQVIPLSNAWLTFVTLPVSRPPVYENKFHFVDKFASTSPVTYTLVWAPKNLNVPEVVSIEGIPAAVTSEQVEHVTVKFNKSIDPTSFTHEDLSLTFQGGANIMSNAVVVTQLDTATFSVDLSALTTGNGFYNLTVQAAGVQDMYGISGETGKQATWTQYLTVPAVQAFQGLPEGNVAAAFNTVQVLFNLPIDETTATAERFRILKENVLQSGLVTIDSVSADKTLFYLSGLGSILTQSGTYKLEVDLPNIKSTDQVAGMAAQSVELHLDNNGPQLVKLAGSTTGGLDAQHINGVSIGFNENVKGFNTAALTLTRNGEVLPLAIDQLSNTDLQNWTVSNLGMLTYPEGNYTFTVNLAGLTDAIGNAGTGTQAISWTVDRSAALAITALAVGPDRGFSATDGITAGLAQQVSFTLSADASQVTVWQVDLSGEVVLKNMTNIAAGAVTVPVTLVSAGSTGIRVTATGTNGGTATAEKQLFIDQVPLSAQWPVLTNQTTATHADAIQLTFNSRLLSDTELLSAISISRNGTSVPATGLSVQKVSDTEYRIAGLRTAISQAGSYQLSCNLQPLAKYSSGLAGTGTAAVAWTVASTNQAPVANAGADLVVSTTGVVMLDASASTDPEADQLTYEWVAPEGVVLSNATTASPSFNVTLADQGKTYMFLLIVRDGDLYSTDVVNVKMNLNAATGITLVGKVQLQGRPEAPHARWQTPLHVSIFQSGQATPLATYQPTTDENGSFSLSNLAVAEGNYVVTVKNSHTLTGARTATLAAGANTVEFGELREGDANSDDKVTIQDFSILGTSYNLAQGSTGYDDRADFNEDNEVTLLDFSLLSGNFNQAGYKVAPGSYEELQGLEAELSQMRAMLSTSPVYLELVKPSEQLTKGETFTMPVMLHTGEQEIDGAEVHLTFDPTRLKVTALTAGTHLPVVLLNKFDNEQGRISFAAGAFANLPKGDLELFSIRFEVIGETGESAVTFTSTSPGQTNVTYRGRSVLSGTSGGTVGIKNCKNCDGKEVVAYPNPTKDKFILSFRGYTQELGKLTIIRMDGAELQTLPLDLRQGNAVEVDLTDYPTGMYLIRLEIGNTTSVHRVLKH